MTRLEYGAIFHNAGENRNLMGRDSGGLNIMKHALESGPYNMPWRHDQNESE